MSNNEDKYERILNAAIDVITEKGFQKTVVSDIVKKANVAQGTFYLYFASKNALIPAIAQKLLNVTLSKIKDRVSESKDFWDALKIYIDETYKITDEYKDVLILCYSGLAFEYSMETWEKIYQPFYEWFEQIINRAIERNEIINDINVATYSKLIINLVENSAERFYIGNDQYLSKEEAKEELFLFVKRALEVR